MPLSAERENDMEYTAFRNEYKKALKAYPDASYLFRDSEDIKDIFLTCKHYVKRGTKWEEVSSKPEAVNYLHYLNIVDPRTIQFFRNLGGYEKVSKGYTKHGYLPIEVTSINPDRTKKTVYKFTF